MPVEIAAGIDRADDGITTDRLQPELPLALPAESRDDLVERQDQIDVVRLPAQPVRQPGQDLAAAGAQEVVLRIGAPKAGLSGHGPRPSSFPARPAWSGSAWSGAVRSSWGPSGPLPGELAAREPFYISIM